MRGRVVPVQLPPALVVLVAVVDRICFKAFLLFRGVQRGFSRLPAHFKSSCSSRFILQFCAITALCHPVMAILISFGSELFDTMGFRLVLRKTVCC